MCIRQEQCVFPSWRRIKTGDLPSPLNRSPKTIFLSSQWYSTALFPKIHYYKTLLVFFFSSDPVRDSGALKWTEHTGSSSGRGVHYILVCLTHAESCSTYCVLKGCTVPDSSERSTHGLHGLRQQENLMSGSFEMLCVSDSSLMHRNIGIKE